MRQAQWIRRIGPGLITACVVIGPGSIMTSSTVGAKYGFDMLWVVVIAAMLMMVFMTLGAKLGAVADGTPAELIRRKSGQPLAIFVGLAVLAIAALFQSGNNIGVAAAFEGFFSSKPLVALLVILFNLLAITFLYAFQDTYRMLERVMATFVAIMLICFAVNLIRLQPNVLEMARGLVPSVSRLNFSENMLPLLGLIGTTFVITGAYYQAYLVRQKGWKVDEIHNGLLDARISASIVMLITIMLMSTAAIVFHAEAQRDPSFRLTSPLAIGEGLQRTFGEGAKLIFSVGLFSAAYSSYLINSMIGGYMAADSLGWDVTGSSRGAKLLTTGVLIVGMLIGLAVILLDFDRTPTIIAAQAITVVAAPVVAAVLLWLTGSRDVMGVHKNGIVLQLVALLGLLVLIGIALKTALIDLPAALFGS
jgi:manganese transport protein